MSVVAVRDPEHGIARAFVVGSIVGFVATFAVCGGIALACGSGAVAASGIGLFTAVWGGPGFGGMMGAVLRIGRNGPM